MVPIQPSIELFGVKIAEPVTGGTDILVTIVCWYAFYKLRRMKEGNPIMKKWFAYYFLTMGLATLFGGVVGHSFQYALSLEWKLPGWFISMLSVMLIERAAIEYTSTFMSDKTMRLLRIINVVELATFAVISYALLDFYFVLIHSAYGLGVVVGGLSWYNFRKTGRIGALRMVQAVGVATVGAIFFINKWYISEWFNHMDIGHTFMALSSVVFYFAARRIVKESL